MMFDSSINVEVYITNDIYVENMNETIQYFDELLEKNNIENDEYRKDTI